MATETREWPNNWMHLRDWMAECERGNLALLMKLKVSKMNPEEEEIIETIMNRTLVNLRALEKAGAQTDPLSELQNIVENSEGSLLLLPQTSRLQQVPA